MKYTLIVAKGQYALILRGESMTQYAVVNGLDKDTGSWDWTCCYYDFGKLHILRSNAFRLADSKDRTAEIHKFEKAAHWTALWVCPRTVLPKNPYTLAC